MKSQSVAKTMKLCQKIRPVLKPFLEAFEPLYTQRQETADRLGKLLADEGISISTLPEDQPILIKNTPENLGKFVSMAALDLLPLLLNLQAIAPHKNELEALFKRKENGAVLQRLVGAMLANSSDPLVELAKTYELPPQVLEFVSEFIISAVLRGLAGNLQDEEFADWRKGICPVCGTAPIIAWLGKKFPVAANDFLAEGGGKKHLHCGMCGTNWYFLRGVCPSCGTQGQDAMQIIGEEERRYERIDWCKKCNTYLPQIDLREMAEIPDMDAMALGLMHLDLVAAEKDLTPLKPSFWNMY